MCIPCFEQGGSLPAALVFESINMNKCLAKRARDMLKADLLWLNLYNPSCIDKFKRMHSYDNMDASISDVVDSIPEKDLSWTITQVHNTLIKFNLKEK